MQRRWATYLLAAAFLAFACWEGIEHVWLVDLPMAAYHVLSLTVECGLLLIIVTVAMALVRRQAEAESRQHALHDTVVTALAQDLRPPLVYLLTEMSLLESSPPEGMGPQTQKLLRETTARGGILLAMIEDLVAMANEARERAPECASLSPRELAEQVLEPHRLIAEERGVRLSADSDEELPVICTAPGQVLRALSILLGNAIRETPAEGEVRLRVTADAERGAVVFSVSDAAPPVLDHAAGLAEAASGAARVGLRYCQTVAEALGGSAWYEPRPGGNAFAFSIPRSKVGG